MSNLTRRELLGGVGGGRAPSGLARPALADAPPPFSTDEIVDSGHHFFGAISRGLAEAVQEAARRWGLPNGYILGQEASGAFVGGLRYGEGKMYTRNAGDEKIFWQGPSIGFDAGGDGDRTMMLVYNLPAVNAIYQPLRRHRRLGLFRRRLRLHRARRRQGRRRADPLRRRRPAGRQPQLPQIHGPGDLEPVLSRGGVAAAPNRSFGVSSRAALLERRRRAMMPPA